MGGGVETLKAWQRKAKKVSLFSKGWWKKFAYVSFSIF